MPEDYPTSENALSFQDGFQIETRSTSEAPNAFYILCEVDQIVDIIKYVRFWINVIECFNKLSQEKMSIIDQLRAGVCVT